MKIKYILGLACTAVLTICSGCGSDALPSETVAEIAPVEIPTLPQEIQPTPEPVIRETTSRPQLAGSVNDTPIYFDAYLRQVARQEMVLNLPKMETGPQAMQTLIEQTIVEQQCAKLGLTITDSELDTEIAKNIGANFNLNDWLTANRLTETELRQNFKIQLLTSRLFEHITGDVPATANQAYIQYIAVPKESTARSMITQLKNGADFVKVSQHEGQLASLWIVENLSGLPIEVEQAAFALQPGQMHGPIKTGQGYFIIHLIEKITNHSIDETILSQVEQQFFFNWLKQQQSSSEIIVNIKF